MSQFELVLSRNFFKFPKEYRDISRGFGKIYAKNNQTIKESPSHPTFALRIFQNSPLFFQNSQHKFGIIMTFCVFNF